MNKKIALSVSILSIVVGVVVIALYGQSRGGEGAVTILGLWGIPLTLLVEPLADFLKLDQYYSSLYYFLFFLQYQLLALAFYKWRK